MSIETNITFWKVREERVLCGSARPVNTGWAITFFLNFKATKI